MPVGIAGQCNEDHKLEMQELSKTLGLDLPECALLNVADAGFVSVSEISPTQQTSIVIHKDGNYQQITATAKGETAPTIVTGVLNPQTMAAAWKKLQKFEARQNKALAEEEKAAIQAQSPDGKVKK